MFFAVIYYFPNIVSAVVENKYHSLLRNFFNFDILWFYHSKLILKHKKFGENLWLYKTQSISFIHTQFC